MEVLRRTEFQIRLFHRRKFFLGIEARVMALGRAGVFRSFSARLFLLKGSLLAGQLLSEL